MREDRVSVIEVKTAPRRGPHPSALRAATFSPEGRRKSALYATFLNLFVRFGCHHAPFSTTPSETILRSPVMCSPVTSA